MQRLRTVTSLDVSAVAGHHAMPAALLFFFYQAEISYCYASHYILIEYHCFILTILLQKIIFVILKWEWNCAFTWHVKNHLLKKTTKKTPTRYFPTPSENPQLYRREMNGIQLWISLVFSQQTDCVNTDFRFPCCRRQQQQQ